jgi:hypothetical protein
MGDLMLVKSLGAFSLIGAIVFATAGSIRAAVPENVIKRWQDSAPEALNVTVLSKSETSATRPYGKLPGGSVTTTNVTLTTQVNLVHRTASGLVPGSVIVVRYEITRYQPPPGPPVLALGIVLNPGERATAYLKRTSEENFQPACAMRCLVKL